MYEAISKDNVILYELIDGSRIVLINLMILLLTKLYQNKDNNTVSMVRTVIHIYINLLNIKYYDHTYKNIKNTIDNIVFL
jgi:hypothetical protein